MFAMFAMFSLFSRLSSLRSSFRSSFRFSSVPSRPMVRLRVLALTSLVASAFSFADTHADDRPFPAGVDVTIPCDTLTLAGTLYSDDATQRTGIVILTGSGEWDRRHPIRRKMIRCLIESGLVVLDFDKRGIGGSGGVYTDGPDLHERASDAAAAIRFLRAQPEIDRVGVWGISQGGWVGQIVAAEDPSLAFAILVSAPGVSPVLQSLYQRMERLRQEGWRDDEVADAYVVRGVLRRYYQTGEGRRELERAWAEAKGEGWFAKLGWRDAPPSRDSLNAEQRAFFTRHGAYEPAPDLARSTVPTLCLFGGKDRHIPVEESVRET